MKKSTLAVAVFTMFVIVTSAGAVEINNMFASRFTLTGSSGSVTGSNAGATLEPGEPCHVYSTLYDYSGYGSNSVWWTWTAPSTAVYGFDSRGTESNVFVCVYTGDNITNLTKIVYNMRHAPLNATNGTTYQIAVVGADVTSTGKVVLNYYENQISPWFGGGVTGSTAFGIAAPNGSLASFDAKVTFGEETRTNQFGDYVDIRPFFEFYAESGITIKDKKGNAIVNNVTPPGIGTQYFPVAFDGKILVIYDQLTSHLLSYKVKKELNFLNKQPLTISNFMFETLQRGSEIYALQLEFGLPPNYVSLGISVFDMKLRKEKWALPVQPGIIVTHNLKKGIVSRQTERTYNLDIEFFKKEKNTAKHNVNFPTRGQVVYCTDGKGGLLYWTRTYTLSEGTSNSPLTYIDKKGEVVFSNKSLDIPGEKWDFDDASLKNFITVVKNGSSATLRSYKINKEMKKAGEVNVSNYSSARFSGKDLIVYQEISDQDGFTVYNSKLKKKWMEPIASGDIRNLGKGVFVRKVTTPGAGETNYHFKIFNKKKTIAEHSINY